MTQLFLHIVNMSISASFLVIAVLLTRLIFTKAPKWISVILWGIVAIRLICPFSIESVLSLVPSAQTISPSIMTDEIPMVNTGIPVINESINPVINESFSPAQGDSANPLQVILPIITVIWLIGIAALLIYGVVSLVRLKKRIGTAVLYKDNVYQSENVVSPFILGIINPKIYVPFNMNEKELFYVLSHEKSHIQRKDHIWKPLGFLILTLHWFNPLMWLSYILLCRDIELACDEKVIDTLDKADRADYSETLVAYSVNRRLISACPIAFGEVGVKDRVKNILSYKKPALWIIIAALIICVIVTVCFLTNPKSNSDDEKGEIIGETDPSKLNENQISLMEKYPEYFGLDASNGLDIYVWQMAQSLFDFGIVPHEESFDISAAIRLKGINKHQLRSILETYDITPEDIYIVPWANPLSSYALFLGAVGTEEYEAKKEVYINNVRDIIFESQEYGRDGELSLIYHNPAMSYVDSYYSGIKIIDNVLYDLESGDRIGALSYEHLHWTNLESQMIGTEAEGISNDIYRNVFLSYKVQPDNLENNKNCIDLYYVVIRNDGTAYLIYGDYANGIKNDTIRWIYSINR